MEEPVIDIDDLVSVEGESGIWTVVGTRSLEPKFRVQLGLDGASIKYVRAEAVTLVKKTKRLEIGPGFVPTRSIMD